MRVLDRGAMVVAGAYGLALAVTAGTFGAGYRWLPDPMATHFRPGGQADGYLARPAALLVSVGLLLALGVLFTLLARPAAGPGPGRRAVISGGSGTAGLLGWLLTAVTVVNWDLARGADAVLPPWQLAVGAAVGLAVAGAAWLLAGPPTAAERAETETAQAGERPAGLPLEPGEAAVWSRTIGSRPLRWAALSSAPAAAGCSVAAFSRPGLWPAAVLLLLTALLLAAATTVRVVVDRDGLRVRPLPLPHPRISVPLARISGASVRRVEALREFGGWGYRLRAGATGLVLRSGEALSLRLVTGREFVVTVDDAATAAALLNGLLERGGAGRPGLPAAGPDRPPGAEGRD
ncbi:DUF1648 domain-containing protein [Streptomyces aidingensis]|uniref:DUF1648 domain-containing protein n=1 Tax=Streptomyces aidingensis TaxID=910347 RepID=A0A1I1IJK5_9ACTN|nr:DUF1648 domain-containing protein [Streptomyces aidingensis]SFC36464.1 hypothetical protein SAMN05421773_10385 [Streptomyces aidingensis]